MSRGDLSEVIAWVISVCEVGESGRKELNRKPPPSRTALLIMNVLKENPDKKKSDFVNSTLL